MHLPPLYLENKKFRYFSKMKIKILWLMELKIRASINTKAAKQQKKHHKC